MAICPVCEHAQVSGDACDVCGRPLGAPGARALAVERVEGLEPTRHADAGGTPPSRLPDLEPTCADPVVDAPAGPAEWVEDTRHLPVALAAPAAPVEVEPTLHPPAPAEPPRDPFSPELCRYCRTPAAIGAVFCERCGMKLGGHPPAGHPGEDA
jgi:hypothetical protein